MKDLETIIQSPNLANTFKQISDFYDEKNKAQKAAQTSGKTSLVGEVGKVNVPAFKNASKPYQNKSSYK